MVIENLMNLLQICDSGFPTGGFSHSSGLEAALKTKNVYNVESLKQFLLCFLENTGSFSLPFVREAYELYKNSCSLYDLDKLCESCMSNHVAKRASTRQGRSMMDTSIKVFSKTSRLEHLYQSLPYKHFPVIFGIICAFLDLDIQAVCAAFLYSGVRTVIASAVRLDKVGPIQAQNIQADLQLVIPKVIERYKHYESKDACMIYPHIDIIQNLHDTMFTKLFYS
ncbi:hypothetical protein ACF0H5_006618 [Mactra antiquata]